MYILGGIVLLVIVLPNTINFKERHYFSDERRLEIAAENYNYYTLDKDSVWVIPGEYYDRNAVHKLFFGKKYRDIWATPVKVPVFSYQQAKGGLTPVKMGGNQQTIGMDLADSLGKEWALRSVNKDQSKALPKILRATPLRFMIRDQAASLNPYGAMVVPVLAEAIGILHTKPRLVLVPYDSTQGEYNRVMAGRLAIVEEDADGSWAEAKGYGKPEAVLDTDEMFEKAKAEDIPVDTTLYARSRLFDLLISDWDRHEGQWSWPLLTTDSGQLFKPWPVDRDMAFYQFNEGLIPKIALLLNKKFQSFGKDYGNLEGLGYQARNIDAQLLSGMSEEEFVRQARFIKAQLSDSLIAQAFREYPEKVYEKIGTEHTEILKIRRDKLPEVAARFYQQVLHKKE